MARSGMREVVELAQRMGFQYRVFAVGSEARNGDFCGPSPQNYDPYRAQDTDEMTSDLMEKLDGSYDIIVLGNVNWSSFPLIVRYRLLKKVNEGTPMVGFMVGADDYFKRAAAKKEKFNLPALVPYKGLPAFSKYKDTASWLDATVECAAFGKGKILTLKGFQVPKLQALTPGIIGNLLEPKLLEYDYYLAWIGHLMRFACGRTAVVVTGKDYVFTNRCDLAHLEYVVSGPEGKTATCVFTLRNDENQEINNQETSVKLATAGTAVRFNIPHVPAGRYFADVWIKQEEKAWAYGSSFIELTGDPSIETVELKTEYRREQKVSGKVRVAARKSAVDGLALVLQQKDTYDRVTARSRIDVPTLQAHSAQEINFEISGANALTIVQHLEVELQKGNEVLDRKEKAFSISNLPPKDDIRMLGWLDGWQSYSAYHMLAELAKAGFDTQYGTQPGKFSEIPPFLNIRHMPYATRLKDRKADRKKDDHVRQPCLSDPTYRKELADCLTKTAEKERKFSATEFSMGDECSFAPPGSGSCYELCFCSACVAVFHKFLANEYQTVEAMNREYGTPYKSFDEVRPVTLEEAKKKQLEPLWVDFRRHCENTWAEIYAYGADAVNKIVPEAKTGYEGSDQWIDSYGAADFYKLMKAMRMNGTYDGAFVPYAVMSFARPGTLLGLGWYGGYNNTRCSEYHRYIAWRHLFRGANSYWVWTSDPCNIGSVMAPDLSLYDFFKTNAAEVREIKRGIGKLLMMSKRAHDGIAILYSASSVHASTLTERLPKMEKVLNALPPLFEAAGRQFQIVAYEQVANGELKKDRYRILWMPYVQAMSRKEAAEVKKFVREGGTVIADLRPGVRDEHGKPYEGGGILDKVFGVKQAAVAMPINCEVKIDFGGYSKTLKKAACDGSIGLGTGVAHTSLADGKPALIVNTYGKGKAILLNFSLSAYTGVDGALEDRTVKSGDDSAEILNFFKVLMSQAGAGDLEKVEAEITGVRLYRFIRDQAKYLCVLQKLPEPTMAYTVGEAKPLVTKPLELKLREKANIYDVRQGKYVGYTDQIKTAIEPANGLLFALLPYQVKGISLNMPKQIGQGETLEYTAAIEGAEHPGLHVFHVEFISPKRETVPYYAGNLVAENGKCKGRAELALNEMTGGWKIKIKDVATGMTAEQDVSIEERKRK
ncbi:MAG: beta-galactosidase trimerization domain-containing protein [Verrucomicrobiae bacterium]|nr:beta-galactosidase trimerization domain-containing protein [Verrucomicrobiae bacterium]